MRHDGDGWARAGWEDGDRGGRRRARARVMRRRPRGRVSPGCGTMRAAFGVLLACCAAGCCVWRPAAALSSESTPLYLRSAYPLWDPVSAPSHSAAEPLLLTPYLRNGHILRARQLARVAEVFRPDHVVSYSGYFTVGDRHNSNLFFWFFPAPVSRIT